MTARHGQPVAPGARLATIGAVVAATAVLFSFVVPGLAIVLALVAVVLAIVVLVQTRRIGTGRGVAAGTIVAAVLAMIIAGVTSSATPQPVAAPSPIAALGVLPASVTVASAQSPDNLITTAGRRLHVTLMQGHPAANACQAGSDMRTASGLLAAGPVRIAAPDGSRLDDPSAVPAGFQSVVLTLPDGRDYAQTWTATAPQGALATCPAAEEPATTSTTTSRRASSSGSSRTSRTDEDGPSTSVSRTY